MNCRKIRITMTSLVKITLKPLDEEFETKDVIIWNAMWKVTLRHETG